jgi:hypothetical protein
MKSEAMVSKSSKVNLLYRALLGLLIGVSLTLALDLQFFGYETFSPFDRLFLILVPAVSLTCCAYILLSYSNDVLKKVTIAVRVILLGLSVFGACIMVFSMNRGSVLLLTVNLISSAAIILGLLLPTATFVQYILDKKDYMRVFFGWLLASGVTFCVAGFLSNFHSTSIKVILTTLLFELAFGIFIYYLLGTVRRYARQSPIDFWIGLFLFIIIYAFLAVIIWLGLQFPKLFDPRFFLIKQNQNVIFIVTSLVFFPWLVVALFALKERGLYQLLRQSKLFAFIEENLAGICLAGAFFAIYLILGSVLNHQRFDVDDIFFDADGFIWRWRLTTDHWQDFYWRAVHPLALLILRPTVGITASLINGDRNSAAILVVALTGSLCVFLAWLFIREALRNSLAALMIATLLGASASHLIFGSLIETYIFLAATLLLFFVLLQRGKDSLYMLVPISLLTIGITLTNFAQNVIALFTLKPDVKLLIRFVLVITILLVPLSLLNNLIYPHANPFFFVPSSYQAETQNIWSAAPDRIQAIGKTVLFFSVAAPTPILSSRDIPFTQFRFYRPEAHKYRLSEYETPLQLVVAWCWLFLLTLASISFFRNLKSRNVRFSIAFLLCIGLNMLIHLRYGKELFLYSSNWTYALVLFLGLAWEKLFQHRWFQFTLLLFLLLLIANNSYLIYILFNFSAPYFN